MDAVKSGADTFFLLMGAVMVLAMHGGFAFLELGTVRKKNQVNALVKILVDIAVSTIVYFFIGYAIAYGVDFFGSARVLSGIAPPGASGAAVFPASGYSLVKFFFLMTFAAAVPAIVSGGVAERMKFWPQVTASAIIIALVYPSFEGLVWGTRLGFQAWMTSTFGMPFHDFAGSVVVHAVGGWIALGAVITLGPRLGRYKSDGSLIGIPPSNIPFLALGSWILSVGWFGFNVMSAQNLSSMSGLVAVNSLMAMMGGVLSALIAGKKDPGFVHNGALAGLVAICAGSDVMHPIGALITGAVAGWLFVVAFTLCQQKWRIDDVLGVWPLHGMCGLWGGIACGIFGLEALGGMGGVSPWSQIVGSLIGVAFAAVSGFVVYGIVNKVLGLRLSPDEEYAGADMSIHSISAYPEEDLRA